LQNDSIFKAFNETVLPFAYSYSEGGTSLLIAQELPSNRDVLNNFFDVINIYAIFTQNREYPKGIYSGMDINSETVKNQLWGASDSNSLEFMVEPFCLKFYSKDVNEIGFADSNSARCMRGFVTDNLQGYDLNITVKQATEDYNRVACNFGGITNCTNLGGGAQQPYFELNLHDLSCVYCQLPSALKNIKGNYDPEASNSITISCQGSGCTSKPIYITIGKGITVRHSGEPVETELKSNFKSGVRMLTFNDFNVTIVDEDFNIVKTNKPNYLN
jgi:hypothetical protein